MSRIAPHALACLASPVSPSARLVIFPCAGSGPGGYSALAEAAPAGWALDAYCAPGRDRRFGDSFAVSLEDLVCEAVAAVASIWPEPNVPVVLVGHSLGGLVAWHVASRLPVDGLVVCGSAPPDALGLGPYPDPDNSTEAYLRQILSAQDVTDSQLREDFVALYAPILDADQRLLDQFAPPADVLECEILALYGERETTPRLAWSDQTKDRALTLTVPGSHFFVLEHPGNVIEAIRKHLRCLVAQPE